MKIVIPGGSGQVGTILARALHAAGHQVAVLSRCPRIEAWAMCEWNGRIRGDWWDVIDGADVVINLTGRSVNCRYHAANRREIMESRVQSVRAIGEAVAAARRPPHVWLQASTATIYSHRYDAPNDEETGLLGGNEAGAPDTWKFSTEVARAWERALDEVDTPRTRKVKLRSAMTMSPDPGGVFATLLGLVRCGLGGRAGDGRQFMSWIHEEDFIRAVSFLIERGDFAGAVNLAAPEPLPNSVFMSALRAADGVPFGLPSTQWMVEVGTRLLRTESELILKSRRVIPTRLLQGGFSFHHPTWPSAARHLCDRQAAWKKA